ncbi:Cysteine protease, C1A family [Peptoclostridium litorale DSM 5388]|uniref:Papain family cysteine protease n=1 Tax=Peptoclostridium litorale DSM 5388 TaxID=1121324 RepID=A0A069RCA2_PEPLI|nr:lectin like domain-containing protein [Peptoclostridium litorale]KDR94631.1 papain family cysteine protease [Peptoclostridium litorale DSM 5388]SIO30575.1 Cysteine protease, C1A family [Peptoclostridium litorale DSM 5388]
MESNKCPGGPNPRVFTAGRLKMLCAVLVFLTAASPIAGFADEYYEYDLMRVAPLSPEFEDYIERAQENSFSSPSGTSASNTRVPSPVKVFGSYNGLESAVELPEYFDLRDQGRLPKVKDQGSLSACWAFGNTAALESALMPYEENDFSENNLVNSHGFEWDRNDGGNAGMAAAYYLRWEGPVHEDEDPYTDSRLASSSYGIGEKKHVQSVYFIPDGEIDLIKRMVMEYGAVSTGVLGASSKRGRAYYNEITSSFYCPDDGETEDHEVNIVGWDDSFPSDNFKTSPVGDGAYICRNSWGDNWGDGGYFYVSYHDATIARDNAVYSSVEGPGNYDSIYQHDEYGATRTLGYGLYGNWFANVFDSHEDQQVMAAGFYTMGMNSEYEIYAVSDYSGEDDLSKMNKVGEGFLEMPGYHTVDIEYPVYVKAGKRFAIAVKISTPGDECPIAIEENLPGYLNAASSNHGESYTSANGYRWYDLAKKRYGSSVCLKVYADYAKMPAGDEESSRPSQSIKVLEPASGVDRLKDWTVSFSDEIGLDSLINIRVFEKNTGLDQGVAIELSDGGKSALIVHPPGGYAAGASYEIRVGGDVYSAGGNQLKEPVSMEFTVSDY